MKIIANGIEIPIETNIGRNEYVGDAKREMIEIWKSTPFTEEEITALTTDHAWTVSNAGEDGTPRTNYNDVVRYAMWIAQADPNAAIIAEQGTAIAALEQEKAAVVAEKEQAVQARTAMQATVNTFLRTQPGDAIIALEELIPEWQPDGQYQTGDPVRKALDAGTYLYTCIQMHDAQNDMNRSPDKAASLWAIYHAKTAQYALPWVAPTHAGDIYKANEWMIWTDGYKYKCLQDADRDPSVLPDRWQKHNMDGTPYTDTPSDTPPATEMNSNGTIKWSEWRDWAGDASKLYSEGDGVTYEGVRKVSNFDGNGTAPTDTTWWSDEAA